MKTKEVLYAPLQVIATLCTISHAVRMPDISFLRIVCYTYVCNPIFRMPLLRSVLLFELDFTLGVSLAVSGSGG